MITQGYLMKLAFACGVLASAVPITAAAADDWQFLLAPYVWFAGAEGHLTPAPGVSAREIDVSAIDAMSHTEASFMLLFEAKKQRQGVLFDVFYSDVLQDSDTDAEYGLPYKAALKNSMVTASYTYEVYSSKNAIINIVGGLRYWQVETHLTLSSGSPEQVSIHNSESWIDPVLGVDTKFRLGDSPFYLSGLFGAGGASGGSDGFYDLSGHIGYQIFDTVLASAGYRVFDVDYQQDAFVYDVKQQGWVIGLVWVLGTPRLASPD
jgi:hypothetical protein